MQLNLFHTYLKLTTSLLLPVLIAGVLIAQPIKSIDPKTYRPLVPDCIADPSIVQFKDTFYLYATTDIDKNLSQAGRPVVWKSTDFVNWSFSGILDIGIDWDKPYAFKNNKGEDKKGYFRYWAPGKVVEKNGHYYLFVTIVSPDDKLGTYVLKADVPEGPFKFINGSGIYFNEPDKISAKPLVNDIDGEPFVNDDGKIFIYWRRRQAAEVNPDFLSIKDTAITLPTKFKGYSEGPGLFKRNNIYYYFYTLSGYASYCNGYMMSRENPLGPFVNPTGNNIFISSDTANNIWGPGHGNVFKVPNKDEYYFIYLEYGEGSTTRQIFANKINFNADGTIQTIVPDGKGVGYLGKNTTKKNLALNATITASSVREPRIVKADVAVNPDLAEKDKTLKGIKVVREFNYNAANAADASNGTRWWAKEDDTQPWLMFDLGKATAISSCEMSFIFPTFGTAWELEKSLNGKDWTVCASQKELNIASPQVADKIGKARFLRVKILKGAAGVWECKIY